MKDNIPKFEGHPVNGAAISIRGTKRFPSMAFDHEEEVIALVKIRCKDVNHPSRAKIGITREHAFVLENLRIPDQQVAGEMMAHLDEEFAEKFEAKARLPLDEPAKAGKDAAAGD